MERLRGTVPSDIHGRLVARIPDPGFRRPFDQRGDCRSNGIEEIKRRNEKRKCRRTNSQIDIYIDRFP